MGINLHSFIFAVTFAVFTEAKIYSSGDSATIIACGLNETQISEILEAHKANNRGPLTWSKELAAAAQTMVNRFANGGGVTFDFHGSFRFVQFEDPNPDVSFTEMINSMFQLSPTNREVPTSTMPTNRAPTNRTSKRRMPTWVMPTWTMPSWRMPQLKFPDFSMFNNFPFRYKRDLTGDYTNMLGCGFLETRNGSNFKKRLMCLYGISGSPNRQTNGELAGTL